LNSVGFDAAVDREFHRACVRKLYGIIQQGVEDLRRSDLIPNELCWDCRRNTHVKDEAFFLCHCGIWLSGFYERRF